VTDALARVDSRELTELQLFAETEPFGEERQDWRMAALMAHLANLERDPKQTPQPYRPEQFLHDLDFERRWYEGDEPATPDPESQIARLDQWAEVLNATTAR